MGTSREPDFKERLIKYNSEDCVALELIFNAITPFCQSGKGMLESRERSCKLNR